MRTVFFSPEEICNQFLFLIEFVSLAVMSKYAKQKGEPHSCGRFLQMSYQWPPSDEEKQTFQRGANSRQNFSKEQKS